ncbi:hypothetical protein SeGA_5983, partial [Salmonella enterica subsp. enterica serovar Gaminara str. A4-567]
NIPPSAAIAFNFKTINNETYVLLWVSHFEFHNPGVFYR